MAVSDIFLLKSLVTVGGKLVVKAAATLAVKQVATKEAATLAVKEGGQVAAKDAVTKATKQGPEVFGELTQELNLPAHSGGTGSAAANAAKAQAGGLMKGINPGKVDLALQTHSTAASVRGAVGVAGKDVQSAHIAAQSIMKGVKGYSPGKALTALLPSATHAAFDNQWKAWAMALRAQGKTTVTAGELYKKMVEFIHNTPNLSEGTKGAMAWRLFEEMFKEQGLKWNSVLQLPYPNIK
jgi:hypothetical protein